MKQNDTNLAALRAYDAQDYNAALQNFLVLTQIWILLMHKKCAEIVKSCEVLFNIGIIYASIGDHQKAVRSHQRKSIDE